MKGEIKNIIAIIKILKHWTKSQTFKQKQQQ